jgi:hypothetical protein
MRPAARHDKHVPRVYITRMRKWLWTVPLFALLAAAFWLAGTTWVRLPGDVPFYGYVAIVGGVFFSLLVGGGLMALMFYSSRHGYDDLSGGDGDNN